MLLLLEITTHGALFPYHIKTLFPLPPHPVSTRLTLTCPVLLLEDPLDVAAQVEIESKSLKAVHHI